MELCQVFLAKVRCLRTCDCVVESCDSLRSQRLRAPQLIQISSCNDQLRGPCNFWLVLHVELAELNQVGRIDFVLRQKFAWHQLEYVEATGNLRPIDVAVIPICRPVSAQNDCLGVD